MSSFVIMSLIPVVSHDPEQVDKQVDEVEIQAQGSHQGHLLGCLTRVFRHGEHLLDLLGVPSGETYEDEHT